MKNSQITTTVAGASCAPAHGSANAPLKVEVEGGRLVISIGVSVLAWASKPENGGSLTRCNVDGRRRARWAKDVANEITREDDQGNSPLAEFLDAMMEAAADSGSAALNWPNETKLSDAGGKP